MSRREAGPTAWALVQRYGRERHPHLVVEGVPASTTAEEVGEALEGWRDWAAHAPAVGLGALVPARKWSTELAERCAGARHVTWAEVTAPRRVTLELTAVQYSRLARAAAIAGEPISRWAAAALADASGATR